MKRIRNGFTMIELLVVVGIMVLLMSIAVAGFVGIRRGAEIRGAMMTLRTTLMLARQESVTKRRTVDVQFIKGASLTDADRIVITSRFSGQTLTNNIIPLPLGIQFDGAGNPPMITFKPSGSASGVGSQDIVLIEKAGAVAGSSVATRGSRTVTIWFLTGITKEL